MSNPRDLQFSDEMKQQIAEAAVPPLIDPDHLEIITIQDDPENKVPKIQCSWSKETCC
jgi:hypothetical protein